MMSFGQQTGTFRIHIPSINGVSCHSVLIDAISQIVGVKNITIEQHSKFAIVHYDRENNASLESQIANAIQSTGHRADTPPFNRALKHGAVTDPETEIDDAQYYFGTNIACDGCVDDITKTLEDLKLTGVLQSYTVQKDLHRLGVAGQPGKSKDDVTNAVITSIKDAGRDIKALPKNDSLCDASSHTLSPNPAPLKRRK